ncbi:hypothetical protein DPMN_153304 [Dreissena polymorpha]|uniref:Uncharacterized protein n=1 Tax=Dreissena polymorpha TaxID=45954 RepID=A0A9D4FJW7_DREPO|nr:hypothetical protein DPMN_153304 [Dreissena polymorpha]
MARLLRLCSSITDAAMSIEEAEGINVLPSRAGHFDTGHWAASLGECPEWPHMQHGGGR